MPGFYVAGILFSNGAVLVYDITDQDSFQKVRVTGVMGSVLIDSPNESMLVVVWR